MKQLKSIILIVTCFVHYSVLAQDTINYPSICPETIEASKLDKFKNADQYFEIQVPATWKQFEEASGQYEQIWQETSQQSVAKLFIGLRKVINYGYTIEEFKEVQIEEFEAWKDSAKIGEHATMEANIYQLAGRPLIRAIVRNASQGQNFYAFCFYDSNPLLCLDFYTTADLDPGFVCEYKPTLLSLKRLKRPKRPPKFIRDQQKSKSGTIRRTPKKQIREIETAEAHMEKAISIFSQIDTLDQLELNLLDRDSSLSIQIRKLLQESEEMRFPQMTPLRYQVPDTFKDLEEILLLRKSDTINQAALEAKREDFWSHFEIVKKLRESTELKLKQKSKQ